MCGIATLISFDGQSPCGQVERMIQSVAHRGPDGEGIQTFYTNDTYVSLAHQRLSIIDLSEHGHQPFSSGDGRFWITYNGEVYNYQEIKQELKAKGHFFVSETDTEVVLKAYEEWGIDCLERFNGMFAFVIYDRRRQSIFAARDRFGVKPLYYWMSPKGTLAFASEIKQFTVLEGWNAKLNPQSAYDYLNWDLTDHTRETLFTGVYQLRGGEYIVSSLSKLRQIPRPQKWYELKSKKTKERLPEAAEKFTQILEDSVRLRLRSDVAVGSCLSGGLDSSSIVCLMDRILSNQSSQQTFSACSDIKGFDEREFMEAVAQHTSVTPHFTTPSLENLFPQLDKMVWHLDEPFGSTSIFAQWEVFKLAKQNNVKVMLDGQGADELLGGYTPFLHRRLFDLMKSGRWIRYLIEARKTSSIHHLEQVLPRVLGLALPQSIRNPIKKAMGRPTGSPSWLNLDNHSIEKSDPYHFRSGFRSSVDELSKHQLLTLNLPKLLRFEDRDSMAHSVEARTPFLDYRLVEFLLSLRSDFKVRDGVTKRVMREGMKGVLPEKVRTRMSKLAFSTPEEVWVKKQPEIFLSEIKKAIDASGGLLNEEALKEAESVIKGEKAFSFLLWRMISFGRWMKVFHVQV